jgi:pimeloyl-ACP methyl ester carboxylesterase
VEPETRYALAGDVRVAYQVVGDGPRDLVLVPGWVSNLEVAWEHPPYERFMRRLGAIARVIVFDKRGSGLSDPVGAAAPIEERIDDIRAVMDAAGSERASLVAHGHAAQMALLAAATHPDRIESLVLLNGFARFARAKDYPAGIPREAGETQVEQVAGTWGQGTMAAVLGPSLAGNPGMTEWYGRLERFTASPGTALAKMRTVMELDVRDVLPLVTAPTLVIQNLGDLYVRAAHAATWPSTSPARGSSSATAPTTGRFRSPTCSWRSRSSSPGRGSTSPRSTAS